MPRRPSRHFSAEYHHAGRLSARHVAIFSAISDGMVAAAELSISLASQPQAIAQRPERWLLRNAPFDIGISPRSSSISRRAPPVVHCRDTTSEAAKGTDATIARALKWCAAGRYR